MRRWGGRGLACGLVVSLLSLLGVCEARATPAADAVMVSPASAASVARASPARASPASAAPASTAPASAAMAAPAIESGDAAAGSIRSIDDAGRVVVLPRPARRVVTLAPALTELVYAAGGGAAMVATVRPNDAPGEARSLPLVGDALRFDVERLLAAKPDLVLAWHHGNPERAVAQLEALGLVVYRLEPRRLDDVPLALERIGQLLGTESAARSRADELRREVNALRAAHARDAPVRLFYQVWSEPLMTVNGRTFLSDVLQACGGRNLFAELAPLVPQLSTETVLAADPEVLFTAKDGFHPAGGVQRAPEDPTYRRWLRFGELTAVRRRWLYVLDADLVTRSGPRSVLGARAVCAALDEVRRERARAR